MATAADVAATDSPVTGALDSALTAWTDAVARALVDCGVPARRSRPLATLVLSTLEGAIMLARVRRTTEPLATVVRELGPVLDAAAG